MRCHTRDAIFAFIAQQCIQVSVAAEDGLHSRCSTSIQIHRNVRHELCNKYNSFMNKCRPDRHWAHAWAHAWARVTFSKGIKFIDFSLVFQESGGHFKWLNQVQRINWSLDDLCVNLYEIKFQKKEREVFPKNAYETRKFEEGSTCGPHRPSGGCALILKKVSHQALHCGP